MKKVIIAIIGLAILIAGIFFFKTILQSKPSPEQTVLQQTLDISREYASLRYRTDDVLVKAKEYGDYDAWNSAMSQIIKDWVELDKNATNLGTSSQQLTEEPMSFNPVSQVMAYTKEEISNIFDKAPTGKKIATLANHLGVDAKMAQLILNQSQDYVSREAYGAEGDVFQTCENGAMRIKNGAKVTVFVGTIVATGGTSALAASGALAQTAVVVSGADLALEVTEDEARIALGDKNKVTEYVSNIRSVTEPAASILTLASIPGNLSKAGEKFAATNFGVDQIRSVVQDKKILGISIKTESNGELKTEIAGLTEDELPQWKQDNNAPDSTETAEEIIKQAQQASKEEIVEEKVNDSSDADGETKSSGVDQPQEIESSNIEQPQEAVTGSIPSQGIAGTYSGSAVLQHVEEDVETLDSLPVTLQLNETGTGTVNVNGYGGEAHYAGSTVSFSVTMKDNGAVVNCKFEGRASRNGSQIVISGNMYFSMMGVTFASYSWSAQK